MNRFDQYVQQQFVPQFVPTPLDGNLMMKALAAKQQSFDTVGAKVSEFAPEVSAYTGDLNDAKQYINDTYEAEKVRIQEELSQTGDTSKAARELHGLNSRYQKDRQTGALYNFAVRKAEDEAYIAEINKIGKLEDRQLAMADYLANRHTPFSRDSYSKLNRPLLFEDPGISDKVNKLIGMAGTQGVDVEGGKLVYDQATGEFKLGITNDQGQIVNWQYKHASEIAPLVQAALLNDPEARSYIAAREQVGAPILDNINNYILSASQLAAFDKYDVQKGRTGSSGGSGGSGSGFDGTAVGAAGNHMSMGKMPWTGNYESTVASLDTKIANAKTTAEKRELLLQKSLIEKKKAEFESSEQGKKLKKNYETSLVNAEDKKIEIDQSFTAGVKELAQSLTLLPAGNVDIINITNNLLSLLPPETLEIFGTQGNNQKLLITTLEKVLTKPINTVNELINKVELLKELETSAKNSPFGITAGRYRADLENTFKATYPELYSNYNAYNSGLSETIKDKDILYDSTDVTINEKDRNDIMATIKPLLKSSVIDENKVRIQRVSPDGEITDQAELLQEHPGTIPNILENLNDYDLTNMVVSFSETMGQTLKFDVKKKGQSKAHSFRMEVGMDDMHEYASANNLPTPNQYIRKVLSGYEGGAGIVHDMEVYDALKAQNILYAPGLDVSAEIGAKEGTKVTYTSEKGIAVNGQELTYADLGKYYGQLQEQGSSTAAVEELIQKLNEDTNDDINENSPIKLERLSSLTGERASSLLLGKVLAEIAPVIENPTSNNVEKKSSNQNLNLDITSNPSIKLPASGRDITFEKAANYSDSQKQWITNSYDASLQAAQEFAQDKDIKNPEVLAVLKVLQTTLETGFGKSKLNKEFHNYGGIKGDTNWKGPVVSMTTPEVINGVKQSMRGTGKVYKSRQEALSDGANKYTIFRVYPSKKEGMKAQFDFLYNNPRYAKVFEASTIEEAIQEVAKAGYATDPDYASKLLNMFNTIFS